MDQEPVAAVSKLKAQPRRTKGRKTPDHQHTTSGALSSPELGSSRQLPVSDRGSVGSPFRAIKIWSGGGGLRIAPAQNWGVA